MADLRAPADESAVHTLQPGGCRTDSILLSSLSDLQLRVAAEAETREERKKGKKERKGTGKRKGKS